MLASLTPKEDVKTEIINHANMKTILLIEDNHAILENLTEYLEMENYRILGTDNGKNGVELAEEFIPDLIICDVYMHPMNGHNVLRLLQDNAKTSGIPFIFSTSIPEIVDKTKALELGADDYIIKPFEMQTLSNMAMRWIKSGSERHAFAV